jgi:hemerythrin-like domain-containing protein
MIFSITESMVKSHKELSVLLERLVDGVNLSSKQCWNLFEDFQARLFEHLNIEERAIFGFHNITDKRSKEIIRELLHEHGLMRSLVDDTAARLKANNHIDLVPFLELMNKHQNIENQVLYPKLDHELDDDEKKDMEGQIKKIIEK